MKRLTPLKAVSGWRRYAEIVAEAVAKAFPDAEVYLVGGAAEGRVTVLSDVDVVVVVPGELTLDQAVEVRARVLEKAEKLGLPPYAPVEIHVVDRKGLARYERRGRLVKL